MISLSNFSLFGQNTASNPSTDQLIQQAREKALLAAQKNAGQDTGKSQEGSRQGDQISISPEAQKLMYLQQLNNPRSERERAADLVKLMPSGVQSLTGGLNWMDAANSNSTSAISPDIKKQIAEVKLKDRLENPMEFLSQIDQKILSDQAKGMGFDLPESLADLTKKQAQGLVLRLA